MHFVAWSALPQASTKCSSNSLSMKLILQANRHRAVHFNNLNYYDTILRQNHHHHHSWLFAFFHASMRWTGYIIPPNKYYNKPSTWLPFQNCNC